MNVVKVSLVALLCCLTAVVSGGDPEDTCSETRVSTTLEECLLVKNDSCSIYGTNTKLVSLMPTSKVWTPSVKMSPLC